MSVAYPFALRTILRAAKSRSQPAAFRMQEPRRGMPFVQAIGTTPPQAWKVQFRFTQSEATRFMLWFVATLDYGELEFTMPLRTESGTVTHQLQFLPDGLMDCGEDDGLFVYEAQMVGGPV